MITGCLCRPFQVAELEDITARAHNVWTQAADDAELRCQQIRQEIEAALKEIAVTKQQLGDELLKQGVDAEVSVMQVVLSCAMPPAYWYQLLHKHRLLPAECQIWS